MIAPTIPAISDATGAGPSVTGLLVATFAVGMALGFVAAGPALARVGAAPVLTASVLLMAAGALCFVAAESLPVFFAGRFLMGMGSGGLWIGISIGVIERWPGEEYRRLTGIMAMYSVGGIAGPALGAAGGIRAPFAAYLGFVLLALVSLRFIGPRHERAEPFVTDRSVLRGPGFFLSAAGVLMVALTMGMLDGVLPLHFASSLGQAEISALYVGTSLVLAVAAVAAGRLPVLPTLAVATVLVVVGIALAGAGDAVWIWIVALAVAAIGFGLADASALGVLLDAVGTGRIVLAMVVWSQAFSIGLVAGPALGGLVAETLGFGAVGLVPLVFSSLVFVGLVRYVAARSADAATMRSRR